MAKYISNRQRNLKIGIVSYTEDKTVLEVTGKVGIGTTNATSKLHVVGDVRVSGVVTATTFVGNLTGTATTAGIATHLKGGLAGNIVYQSGLNATAFLANGDEGKVLQSNGIGNNPTWVPAAPSGAVSGLVVRNSTNTIVGTSGSISQLTFGTGLSVTGSAGPAGIATITLSSNIVGTSLSITGISTFTNGPILVGTGTSTGTASQPLQVTGGAYVSDSVGIGTTNPTSKLDVGGDIRVSGVVTASRFVSNVLTGTAPISVASSTLVDNLNAQYVGGFAAPISQVIGSTDTQTLTSKTIALGSNTITGTLAEFNTALTDANFVSIGGTETLTNKTLTSPVLTTPSLGIATATSIVVGSGVTINASGINAPTGIVTATQFVTGASGSAIGISTNTISGPATITIDPAAVGDNTGAVRIKGDLYVDGDQFIVNSTTIELADFNVGIATTVGTNADLDGAGIGIGSASIRKTIQWANASSSLKSSENFNLASSKTYKIDGTDVLSNNTLASGVVNSSLTSVGTLGQLQVTGISTFTNGPILVGTATSTGTALQRLQVTDGAYVSGSVGIGTTNPTSKLHVAGNVYISGIATLTQISAGGTVGTAGSVLSSTGSGLSWIPASSGGGGVSISTNTTNQSQFLTYVTGTGTTTGLGVNTTSLVFNPSTKRLGIGTDTLTTTLNIGGVLGFTDNNIRIGDADTGCSLILGACGEGSAYDNFFAGSGAGKCNTSGLYNNFFGKNAGRDNTDGRRNNFFGNGAGVYNTTGNSNNFFGPQAGVNNRTGCNNNFLGDRAGAGNTTGSNNNFFGKYSGHCNTTGSDNNFLGGCAACTQTSGNRNVALGHNVRLPNITGSDQLVIGSGSTAWISGNSSFNVGIGTTNPTSKLHVAGNGYFSGIVTSSGFYVDGSLIGSGSVSISGVSTSSEFVGGGSDLRNLSGTHLVSYASASDISNSALSISGINTYTQVGILTGSLVDNYDTFGISVATSADGKTIIVGASADDSGTESPIDPETGLPGSPVPNNSGVVYVYDRVGNSYNQVGILTGSLAVNDGDRFGDSVATSADGKTIIVGAYNDEIGATETTGVVYVFDRVGNSFNQVGILTGSLATSTDDNFGSSVATSADGKTIIVGAPADEIGATASTGITYVFDRVGSSFNQVGILTGSLATSTDDNFGQSVATSADGKTIIVGAYNDEIGASTSSGVVYVFDRVGSSFNQVGILTGSLGSSDRFGNSVATSADGKTIIVGAREDEIGGVATETGIVFVYDRVGNSFNQVGILTGSLATSTDDNFGSSVATSADGKTIIVGAYNDEIGATTSTGVVYVFNRQGNSFNQVGILTGSLAVNSSDLFGFSVATSADGKTIIVGAYNDEITGTDTGLAYVFDQTRQTYVHSGPTGNIGIGTTNPTSKLHVIGDVRVGINTSQGVILSSANGTNYRLLVSNAGVLSTSLVT